MNNKLGPPFLDINRSLIPSMPPRPPSPAESAFNTLVEQIREFETTLTDEEAVGSLLASFGQSVHLNINSVRRVGQFIRMDGTLADGGQASLVQHFTQISVLLLKVNTEEPRKPIGFITE
jgi:hypothetical protein